MMCWYIVLLCILRMQCLFCLDNGVGRTPPMGWLQWERYQCTTDCETYPNQCVSEGLFKRTADVMAADGYVKAGYQYINIDDCWPEHARNEEGVLVADKKRFPSGIKSLADYNEVNLRTCVTTLVNAKGLKLGIYTDFGTSTCAGYPASIFHMEKDAMTFASWNIEMLKVDGCNTCNSLLANGYKTFGWYLNQTAQPILYSCSWPAYMKDKPYADVAKSCNIWRNYADIRDSWQAVLDIINYNGDHQDEIIPNVGPGHFNDMDMLMIGDYGLSRDESKTQFAIWSILAAPLFLSADLSAMLDWQKEILLNSEVIAVNQDTLGRMGRRVYKDNRKQTWMKPLVNESLAVAIMSTGTAMPVFMSVEFSLLNVTTPMHVRDLFAHKDLGVFNSSFKAMVNPSGVVMVKLTKA